MPEDNDTIEKLRKDLHFLTTHLSNFRDQAIVEIARLQVLLAPNPSAAEWSDRDNTVLLERERALRQKLGLPVVS